MELDAIDKQLLELLQVNADSTIKALALELNLSTTAVHERIKKLERNGIITHYAALVDKKKVGRDFIVLCHIQLEKHRQESIQEFEAEVSALKEVLEVYHVSGQADYILKVCVTNMEAYREFVVNKLTKIRHIGSTQSTFVISEVKNSTAITW